MVRMALVVFPSRMHNARVASAGALGGIGILLQEVSEFPKILSKPRIVGAAIAHGSAGAAKHRECARAALAANIPERKTERRIRGQARSYKNLLKPRGDDYFLRTPSTPKVSSTVVLFGPRL